MVMEYIQRYFLISSIFFPKIPVGTTVVKGIVIILGAFVSLSLITNAFFELLLYQFYWRE